MDDETEARTDTPDHKSAATVAGLQFILGIGMTLGVLIPVLIFVFVLLPMGWGAVVPTTLMLLAIGLLGRIAWLVRKAGK